MLERMAGMRDGVRDALTFFTKPMTGAYYFVPSIQGIKEYMEG
jgi:putative iron-dependent peroxidase